MMGQITKMTPGCNNLCMQCNPNESVKLACVMLLFEDNNVTVTRTNISKAKGLNSLGIQTDQKQVLKADLESIALSDFLGTRLGTTRRSL